MKVFLKTIGLFFVGVLLIVAAYVFSFSSGHFDFYYKRVALPKQHSLVLGVSRAAQGIVPSKMDSVLGPDYAPLFNYAFAANYSPFGRVYFNAIKGKLKKPSIKKAMFILTVDPRSISVSKDHKDTNDLIDQYSFLNHLDCFACEPNLDYILYGHETYYKKIFLNMIRGEGYLHNDGWLEIIIDNSEASRNSRMAAKLKDQNYERDYTASDYRLKYMLKTIDFLMERGEVYLVRLPLHSNVLERQNESYPDFDHLLETLALKRNIPYWDYSQDYNYNFTDGSHMTAQSARRFSIQLAQRISSYTQRNEKR